MLSTIPGLVNEDEAQKKGNSIFHGNNLLRKVQSGSKSLRRYSKSTYLEEKANFDPDFPPLLGLALFPH